ncbi:MAG: hypothetical protein IJ151_02115 [Bacteroidales bacterium]|nr:hypothetical protein [Bacteroidales bacterium]
MKPALKYTLTIAAGVACIVLLVVLNSENSRRRGLLSCQGLKVNIVDSAQGSFVTAADIKEYILAEEGPLVGKRADSIKLWRIEENLKGKAAILGSEAYMSSDGILHVEVRQRKPVARFHSPSSSFYADASGFIFPIRKKYAARLPIVDGDFPFHEDREFKGEITDKKGREWMKGMIGLLTYLEKNKTWRDAIVQITSSADGSLILVPAQGDEKFIFGYPEHWKEKFEKMEKYYEYIAPREEGKKYKTVNVRYKGQIICR